MITVIRPGHGSIDKCLIIRPPLYDYQFADKIGPGCGWWAILSCPLQLRQSTEMILIKCSVQYYNEGTPLSLSLSPLLLCMMSATEITDNTMVGHQPQHTGHFSQGRLGWGGRVVGGVITRISSRRNIYISKL